MRITRFIDGQQVAAGATWSRRPFDWPRPSVTVECVATDPDRYVAHVSLHGQRLFSTGETDDPDRADQQARRELERRLTRMLSE